MDNVNGKPLGITFYCPDSETFTRVAKLKNALEDAGIATMWKTTTYEGRAVPTLNVYENANVVAGYLPALDS